MENFRRLRVWQRAHALAVRTNHVARGLPREERFELASQMRRSASSVAFNIAEACGRKVAHRRNADVLRCLAIASGSLHELDAQLEYARDVGYLTSDTAALLLAEVAEIRKMLAAFIRRLREDDRGG